MKEPRVIDSTFKGNILHKYQKQIRDDKRNVLLNNVEQFLRLNDMEKTSLLMDSDADKTLRILAEIDSELKECSPQVKAKILECTLQDKEFIKKCKYYRVTFNFTKQIWEDSDVKHLVSKSVINGANDDLHFYNILLAYGQKEIFDEYLPRTINKNKHLKYILDKCGFRVTKQNEPGVVGHRGYVVDPKVKEYYGYVK